VPFAVESDGPMVQIFMGPVYPPATAIASSAQYGKHPTSPTLHGCGAGEVMPGRPKAPFLFYGRTG
jgi:hypothetical protein